MGPAESITGPALLLGHYPKAQTTADFVFLNTNSDLDSIYLFMSVKLAGPKKFETSDPVARRNLSVLMTAEGRKGKTRGSMQATPSRD